MPEDRPEIEMRGVAKLFKTDDLRKFVKRFLYLILFLEIFTFLVFFLCQLEPINIPFSWKNYFLAAMLLPIAVTLLTGVFVTAFDLFLLPEDRAAAAEAPGDQPQDESIEKTPWHKKLGAAIYSVRQMPFLLSLLLLCVVIIAVVHVDRLFLFFSNVSESAIIYGFWGFAVLLSGATLLAVVLLISRYRLEKDRQQQEYQYRQEMAVRMGVVITERNLSVHTKRAEGGTEEGERPLLTHDRPADENAEDGEQN